MSLTQKFTSSHGNHSPFSSRKPPKPFEETLIFRLKSLPPIPSPPSVPISWLVSAVHLLSATLSSASALLSDPSLAGSDSAALSSHLDSSADLLDAVNAITAEIGRISCLRLHLRLALHLLSDPNPKPDSVSRARDLLSAWTNPKPSRARTADLKNLALNLPRGKISAFRRAIYAVEAVSVLVVGSVLASLGFGSHKPPAVPAEFPWSEAFNKVSAAICACDCIEEVVAVDDAVKNLTCRVGVKDEVELKNAVLDTEKKTEELTEGLDRFGKAVDGLFRAGLGTRDAALQSFRVGLGPKKCK